MYTTSADYKTAIAQPVLTTRFKCKVTLANATVLNLTDADVLEDSIYLDETCIPSQSVDLDVGNAGCAEFGITIKDAGTYDFAGAKLEPSFGLIVTGSTYEDIPLGVFWVTNSARKMSAITLTCWDAMQMKFAPAALGMPPTSGSPYTYLAYAATQASVTMQQNSTQIGALPNGGMTITYPTGSGITTPADIVMWVAQLLGCFAHINRDGKLNIKRLTGSSVRNIDTDIRFSTQIADHTKHVTAVKMTLSGTEYTSAASPDDGTTLIMVDNPLIKAESAGAINTILGNIRTEIGAAQYRPSEIEFNGDPSIELGDYVTLTGGAAGAGVLTMITSSHWIYRGKARLSGIGLANDVTAQIDQVGKKILILNELYADIVKSALFKGKTIELGGAADGDGTMEIKDGDGNVVVCGNKDGIKIIPAAAVGGSAIVPFIVMQPGQPLGGDLLSIVSINVSGSEYLNLLSFAGGFETRGNSGKLITIGPDDQYISFYNGSTSYILELSGSNLLFDTKRLIVGTPGTSGHYAKWDASGNLIEGGTGGGGSGDVVGPASATSGNFASFGDATGKLIADSGKKAADFATAAQGTKADNAAPDNGYYLGSDGAVLLGSSVPGSVCQNTNSTGSTNYPTQLGVTFTFNGDGAARTFSIHRATINNALYIQFYSGTAGTGWLRLLTPDGITLNDAADIVLGTTTGTKIGTGATQKLGFFGVTPVVKPGAISQTAYATASATVNNLTQVAAPAGGTGTAAGGWDTAANRNLAITSINAARTDIINIKQTLNQVIDVLQSLGLMG